MAPIRPTVASVACAGAPTTSAHSADTVAIAANKTASMRIDAGFGRMGLTLRLRGAARRPLQARVRRLLGIAQVDDRRISRNHVHHVITGHEPIANTPTAT